MVGEVRGGGCCVGWERDLLLLWLYMVIWCGRVGVGGMGLIAMATTLSNE